MFMPWKGLNLFQGKNEQSAKRPGAPLSLDARIEAYNEIEGEKISHEVRREYFRLQRLLDERQLLADPVEGYKHVQYEDPATKDTTTQLIVGTRKDRLWSVFEALMEPLGSKVDVIVNTHNSEGKVDVNRDFYREQIDVPILLSLIEEVRCDILDDAHISLTVLNPETGDEIQFDYRKVLYVLAHSLHRFENILQQQLVLRRDSMSIQPLIVPSAHGSEDDDHHLEQIRAQLHLEERARSGGPDGWDTTA